MRVALALNTLLAVGTTGVFLAYLVTVIIDAISLTDNSAVLAKNWHAIVMLTWLSLVAFAWLLAEIIVDACRRHARNRAIASIDDDADMNNGHDARSQKPMRYRKRWKSMHRIRPCHRGHVCGGVGGAIVGAAGFLGTVLLTGVPVGADAPRRRRPRPRK